MTPANARWLVTAALVGLFVGIGFGADSLQGALIVGLLVGAGVILGFLWATADIAADRQGDPQRRQ